MILGQIIGIYLFVMGIVLIAYFHEWQEAIEEFTQSKMFFYLGAQVVFLLGVILAVLHTKFSGDILEVSISAVAYVLIAKGLFLLLLPHSVIGKIALFFNSRWLYVAGGILMLVIGGFFLTLTFLIPMIY